ncbi:MAG: hypothetical protein ACRDRJ_46215 [Streptosporangiaceae bacterium]
MSRGPASRPGASRGRAKGWGAGARGLAGWGRRWYGAEPLHLLALLAAFALAGYAVRGVVAADQWRGFALWFAVAIVGHDLLLFPLYSLADWSVRRLLPSRPAARRHDGAAGPPAVAGRSAARPGSPAISPSETRIFDARPAAAGDSGPGGPGPGRYASAGSAPHHSGSSPAAPPAINYIRVPAAFSLLLLLVWFPLILGLSSRTYHRASGLVTSPYLGRWLAVTGVLFAASAASYALALRRASAPARQARRSRRRATSSGRRSHTDGAGRASRRTSRSASRHRHRRFH